MNNQIDSTLEEGDIPVANEHWSLPTRLLHLGMVVTVSAQLGLSLLMEAPDEENISALAAATFEAHEVIGMAALVIVMAHWLWTLFQQADGGWRHLFPWFGSARKEVVREFQALFSGQLPQGGVRGGLPGFIHGLGLLGVSGMVISGGILFFLLPESGPFPASVEFFAEIHEIIAPLVWLYWGGHAAAGVIHHLKGETILKDMFSFSGSK